MWYDLKKWTQTEGDVVTIIDKLTLFPLCFCTQQLRTNLSVKNGSSFTFYFHRKCQYNWPCSIHAKCPNRCGLINGKEGNMMV